MSSFKDKLRKMVGTIKETAVDFSSLEVTTLNGEISQFIDAKGKFDVDKVNNFMAGNITVQGEIHVIAHTHMAFDQDTLLFTKKDMTPEEREIFQLHLEMLASARVSRLAFLHFIKEIID